MDDMTNELNFRFLIDLNSDFIERRNDRIMITFVCDDIGIAQKT